MSKLIPVKNSSLVVEVDDEDYLTLKDNTWTLSCKGYPFRKSGNRHIFMHRRILNTLAQIDHIDGNKLNNKRSNLRISTTQQNCANRSKFSSTTSSKYKGVSFRKDLKQWAAYIRVNYRRIHLGYFTFEEDAARAYDKAALRYFKEFANLNFPLVKTEELQTKQTTANTLLL